MDLSRNIREGRYRPDTYRGKGEMVWRLNQELITTYVIVVNQSYKVADIFVLLFFYIRSAPDLLTVLVSKSAPEPK